MICGFPRGGTSLLFNMMAVCLPTFQREEFETYIGHRLHRFGNVLTKAPLDVFSVRHIDKWNVNRKEVSIIVVVRDIRDVITSRHPILPNEYFIGHDHSWWPQDFHFKEWKYDAPGIVSVHDEIQAIRGRSDVMILRYEDLISDPDFTQRSLAVRFGLSFQGHFSAYHQDQHQLAYKYEGRYAAKDQSLVMEGKAVSGSRVARWKTNKDSVRRIHDQFQEEPRLFEVLQAYGYETDNEWFAQLLR